MRFVWFGLISLFAISDRLLGVDSTNIECVSQMELPLTIEALAGEPLVEGESINVLPEGAIAKITERNALVQLVVGRGGVITDIRVSGSSKGSLNRDLGAHLRTHMTLDPKCAGKTIKLSFVFRFGGTVRRNPSTRVTFHPPNQFIIEREPGIAIVDDIPLGRR
jgi:hypothetical protein